jgi:hypothetical protein
MKGPVGKAASSKEAENKSPPSPFANEGGELPAYSAIVLALEGSDEVTYHGVQLGEFIDKMKTEVQEQQRVHVHDDMLGSIGFLKKPDGTECWIVEVEALDDLDWYTTSAVVANNGQLVTEKWVKCTNVMAPEWNEVVFSVFSTSTSS